MYKIKVSYQTGDSFGTEDVEMTLDFDWTDINVVTQNLKRIKEHYEMYQEMAESYHAPFKEMKKKYGKKDWFVDNNGNSPAYEHLYRNLEPQLKKEQRRLSKKKRYSNNWYKQLHRVNLIHEKIAK